MGDGTGAGAQDLEQEVQPSDKTPAYYPQSNKVPPSNERTGQTIVTERM